MFSVLVINNFGQSTDTILEPIPTAKAIKKITEILFGLILK